MKILITERGEALNTAHIANLFYTPAAEPSPAVPDGFDLARARRGDSTGYLLILELGTGRFLVAERCPDLATVETTFWLLLAEMQYDTEPRTITFDDLRRRGIPNTIAAANRESILDFTGVGSWDD